MSDDSNSADDSPLDKITKAIMDKRAENQKRRPFDDATFQMPTPQQYTPTPTQSYIVPLQQPNVGGGVGQPMPQIPTLNRRRQPQIMQAPPLQVNY